MPHGVGAWFTGEPPHAAIGRVKRFVDRTGQTLLGKYELTRMLGRGGMGEVWEGEHAITGRRVAVKVLSDKYLSNRKVVKRFGREARAASAVNHPGIVEILDHDRTPEGVPFLVMEFLDGQSLGERLRERGKLSQAEALNVMLPLLDALDAAHRHGVIHRDLKPDNIYLSPDSRGPHKVKILDFGISQKADEIDHKLTQEGAVLGTPHYMSPEQARGALGIDARADIYAAGVLLYELVVGDVPFDAGNYNALLQIILGDMPVPPRQRGADICQAVEQVIMSTLEKDRDLRPADARTFRSLLAQAVEVPEGARLDVAMGRFQTGAPGAPQHAEVPAVDSLLPSFGPSVPPDASEDSLFAPADHLPFVNESVPPMTDPGRGEAADPFADTTARTGPGVGEIEAPPDLLPLELAAEPRSPSVQGLRPVPASLFPAKGEPPASPAAPSMPGLESPTESLMQQVPQVDPSFERMAGAAQPARFSGRPPPVAARTSARGAVLAERISKQRSQRGSGLRTLGRWLLTLLVIAGVVFVISRMFQRDDARRQRPADAMQDAP